MFDFTLLINVLTLLIPAYWYFWFCNECAWTFGIWHTKKWSSFI